MKKLALGIFGVVALAATLLYAQPVIQNQLSGNECWNAGQGPGGPSAFLCINMVRHTWGANHLAATSGTISPTTATGIVNITAQPNGSLTINTPASPVPDGFNFQICNTSNAAFTGQTITLAASTGQSLATGVVTALTTQAARTCEELIYQLANTTWYQIR